MTNIMRKCRGVTWWGVHAREWGKVGKRRRQGWGGGVSGGGGGKGGGGRGGGG